jgi:hypothetical protein
LVFQLTIRTLSMAGLGGYLSMAPIEMRARNPQLARPYREQL